MKKKPTVNERKLGKRLLESERKVSELQGDNYLLNKSNRNLNDELKEAQKNCRNAETMAGELAFLRNLVRDMALPDVALKLADPTQPQHGQAPPFWLNR